MTIRILVPVLAIFLVWATFPAAAGELVIVASSAPNFKPGQIIKTDPVIEVPAGTSITVVSQTGKSLTLKGPYSGSPALSSEDGGDGRVVSSLSNLLLGPGKEKSLGAVRAGRGLTPPGHPEGPRSLLNWRRRDRKLSSWMEQLIL